MGGGGGPVWGSYKYNDGDLLWLSHILGMDSDKEINIDREELK